MDVIINIEEIANVQFWAAKVHFDEAIQHQQLMCRINDQFVGPDGLNHACIGCNLDDQTQQISKLLLLLAQNSVELDVHHRFSLYVSALNGIWERLRDIFEIISVPEGYLKRHFDSFMVVRKWANFFKHPKTFGWFVHHPIYTIRDSDHHRQLIATSAAYRFVDNEFLEKYYSADCKKNAHKLRGEFVGFERSTVVLLPNISDLTTAVTTCMGRFVTIITQNPIYVEMLSDHAVIENYFAVEGCPMPEEET